MALSSDMELRLAGASSGPAELGAVLSWHATAPTEATSNRYRVENRDVETEGEVAVRGLQEREARMPAMQVALEVNGVRAELPRVEIVVRIPGRRPMRCRLERKSQPHLLAPRAAADKCRVRLWPRAALRVRDRQVEPPAPPADRYRPRPRKRRLTDATDGATYWALGSGGRRGGGRARGGALPQPEQGGDAADRRGGDGEPGRDV